MSLLELVDFGKWSVFIWACYAIATAVLLGNVLVSYQREKRLLREIAQKLRRDSRGLS